MCNFSAGTDKIGEDKLALFQSVVYTPVFVAGLVLNISALYFFSRIRQWTITHIYMANLIVADLLLILFLPFRIFETFSPIKPSPFCTFLISVHYSNMYVSIFTITAISVHRFLAVRFPLWTKGVESKRKARVVCAFIWIAVMSICTGFHGNLLPKKLRKCYELKEKISTEFLAVLEIFGYLLPIVTITVCLTTVICTVKKSAEDNLQNTDKKSMEERKRVVAVIIANMIVFMVCFTPVHVGYLMKYFFSKNDIMVDFSHVFFEVSEWIATTNCCLDSVGYYFLLKHVFRGKDQSNS